MCINYCYLGTSERRLNTGGEGDCRGWDGWMASPTQWTWVWASFGSWWWTGKPDLLQSMGHKEWDRTEWLNWKQRRGEGLSWEGLFSPPLLHWEVTHLALTYLHSVPATHFCINQIKFHLLLFSMRNWNSKKNQNIPIKVYCALATALGICLETMLAKLWLLWESGLLNVYVVGGATDGREVGSDFGEL